MKIIGIETSCDETSASVIEAKGGLDFPKFKILSNIVASQIDIHQKYGGVFPSLAKREHVKNIMPVFIKSLKKASILKKGKSKFKEKEIKKILKKEPDLLKEIKWLSENYKKPDVKALAVTYGPGLEPALWVGINFSKAIQKLWDLPIIQVNHMEGHIASVLTKDKIEIPAIALLISGGHTEIILIKKGMKYKILGQTLDDAVGEAFDKVARMMSLPYPGGPEISKLAIKDRNNRKLGNSYNLPRPMIKSNNLNFSFSGLKTSILYTLKKIPSINQTVKEEISREFEDSVIDVLLSKTESAVREHKTKTLIIAGGVSANNAIRKSFKDFSKKMNLKLLIPDNNLTTDNASMIAMAGYINTLRDKSILLKKPRMKAQGNLRIKF